MRQTIPRRTPTRNFMVSGGANGYYTLLKGDPEVVVAKGNLIIPRRNSTTGRSFVSYPGQLFIIIIIYYIYYYLLFGIIWYYLLLLLFIIFIIIYYLVLFGIIYYYYFYLLYLLLFIIWYYYLLLFETQSASVSYLFLSFCVISVSVSYRHLSKPPPCLICLLCYEFAS